MSTKVGVIAEGAIDLALLPPLLERIARDRAGFAWPVNAEDMTEFFPIRKRGFGGVVDTVQKVLDVLEHGAFEHAFFVVLLDRRTRQAQEAIRDLLPNTDRFLLAVAMEEIEAWWLGDRRNTLAWSGLADCLPDSARYAAAGYKAESDDKPKATLNELTQISARFDRCYGEGNLALAVEFAEDYWGDHADLASIRVQCPRGYGPFERQATQRFRSAAAAARRAR